MRTNVRRALAPMSAVLQLVSLSTSLYPLHGLVRSCAVCLAFALPPPPQHCD